MSWTVAATHASLLAGLGLAFEVCFTALMDARTAGNLRLMGYTYLWMLPAYGLVYPLLSLLYPLVSGWPLPLRGLLYTGLAILLEYSIGRLLRAATGECPWEKKYYPSHWSVHGLTRLDYAPAWFMAGILFEFAFRVLKGLP